MHIFSSKKDVTIFVTISEIYFRGIYIEFENVSLDR